MTGDRHETEKTAVALSAALTCAAASAAGVSDDVVKIGGMPDKAGIYATLTGFGSVLA